MGKSDIFRIVLKCFLTVVFFLAGACKVTPRLHPDAFIELDVKFRESIGPAWQEHVFNHIDYTMSAVDFKFAIGVAEVLTAAMLWTPMSDIACLIGVCVMIGAIATHYLLEESLGLVVGLLICFLLVLKLGRKDVKSHVGSNKKKK